MDVENKIQTTYMTEQTRLPAFLPYPRFLLDMDLTQTCQSPLRSAAGQVHAFQKERMEGQGGAYLPDLYDRRSGKGFGEEPYDDQKGVE